ncbi:MAG: hypothetical protein HGA27_01870 [Peptococcaceae bacterium]|nr:hypothetical protein [Peptococcaceae bacterium]
MKRLFTRDMNFLPDRIVLEHREKRSKRLLVIYSFLLSVVFLLMFFVPYGLERKYENQLTAEKKEIATLNKSESIYNNFISRKNALSESIDIVNQLERDNLLMILPFVQRVSEQFPAGAYISQLSISSGNGADIVFTAPGPVEVAKIALGLRRMDVFKAVDIEKVPLTGGSEKIQFNLIFKDSEQVMDNRDDEENRQNEGAEINAAIGKIKSNLESK